MTQEPSSGAAGDPRVAFSIVRDGRQLAAYVTVESQRRALREEARRLGGALYAGRVKEEGGRWRGLGPWVIDWDTVGDVRREVAPPTADLRCPYCEMKPSSFPGLTNHVKAKHPDRLAEYRAGR